MCSAGLIDSHGRAGRVMEHGARCPASLPHTCGTDGHTRVPVCDCPPQSTRTRVCMVCPGALVYDREKVHQQLGPHHFMLFFSGTVEIFLPLFTRPTDAGFLQEPMAAGTQTCLCMWWDQCTHLSCFAI